MGCGGYNGKFGKNKFAKKEYTTAVQQSCKQRQPTQMTGCG